MKLKFDTITNKRKMGFQGREMLTWSDPDVVVLNCERIRKCRHFADQRRNRSPAKVF
jgi:hypothetical protein